MYVRDLITNLGIGKILVAFGDEDEKAPPKFDIGVPNESSGKFRTRKTLGKSSSLENPPPQLE